MPVDDNIIVLDSREMWVMPANRVGEVNKKSTFWHLFSERIIPVSLFFKVVHVALPDREVDVRTLRYISIEVGEISAEN